MKKHMKVLYNLLCAAILFSSLAIPTLLPAGTSAVMNHYQDYSARTHAILGNGTADDPYIITNVNDLQAMNNDLGAWYELGNDIDANATSEWNGGAGFIPIGNNTAPFSGNFNGEGHTISNLYINMPSTDYIGLFGYVTSGAIIGNLTLSTPSIQGWFYVGSVVGYCDNAFVPIQDITVTDGLVSGTADIGGIASDGGDFGNDVFAGDIIVTGVGFASAAGGIVGEGSGNISNCTFNGSISLGNSTGLAGGIVAFAYGNIEISDCQAEGSISGASAYEIGGIAGHYGYSFDTLTRCSSDVNIIGYQYCGGIVGFGWDIHIEDSYSTGSVLCNQYGGGIIGRSYANNVISTSFSSSNVTATNGLAGGIAGYNGYGNITDCYSRGEISASDAGYGVGGLIGWNYDGNVTNCYSTGVVDMQTGNHGGLIGQDSSGTYNNCFWDTETSGQSTSAGGTGKTTAEMKTQSTYVDWDFTNIWALTSCNDEYPCLRDVTPLCSNNHPPDKPEAIYPTSGMAVGLDNTIGIVCFVSSKFNDPDYDPIGAVHFQVTENPNDWDHLVYERNRSVNIDFNYYDQTILNDVPSSLLKHDTTYYWRVMYEDSHGAQSDWSDVASFNTSKEVVIVVHGYQAYAWPNFNDWIPMTKYLTGDTSIDEIPLKNPSSSWYEDPVGPYEPAPGNDCVVYISNYSNNIYHIWDYDNILQGTHGDIKDYADNLGQEIQRVLAQEPDVSKVDIVAHSMGGLVARRYIESSDFGTGGDNVIYRNNVGKLIMLATPNKGVAYDPLGWLDWLGSYSVNRAEVEMAAGSDFLTTLNSGNDSPPEGVKYYTIAGYDTGSWLGKDYDGAVSRYRVVIPGVPYAEIAGATHNEMKGDGTSDAAAQARQDVYDALHDQFQTTIMHDPEPSLVASLYGNIQGNETQSYEVPVTDANSTSFALVWPPDLSEQALSLTLISPSEVVIDPTVAETDPNITYSTYSSDSLLPGYQESYVINQPEAGNWTVNIEALDVPQEGADYMMMSYAQTDMTLSVTTGSSHYEPGNAVTVIGELKNGELGVPLASVTAEITDPANITQDLVLYDDGLHNDGAANDGVYANQYGNTTVSGNYDIKVTATGILNGEEFQRQGVACIPVEKAPNLSLATSDISFSDDTPADGENVTITATIHNIGEVDVNQADVWFYDGDPLWGDPIGNATVSVASGNTSDASVLWTAVPGDHDIHVTVSALNSPSDADGSDNAASKTIEVSGEAINVNAGGPYVGYEGSAIVFDAGNSTGPTGMPLQYRWSYGSDGCWDTGWSTSPIGAQVWDDEGNYSVTVEVGNSTFKGRATASVTVINAPPVVDAGGNQTVHKGDTVNLSGSFFDLGQKDTHNATIDWGDGTVEPGNLTEVEGSGNVTGSHVYMNNGVYTVTVTVTDDDGGVGNDTLTVTVNQGCTAGSGFTWRDAWQSGGNYTAYDVCYYDGSSYACILSIDGGTTSPDLDAEHWAIMARAGDTGSQGPQGEVGPQGPAGTNGTNGTNGATWYNGSGGPGTGLGADNDYYYNTSNGNIYQKQSGSWTQIGNIMGPQGAKGDKGDQGEPGSPGAPGNNGQGYTWRGNWTSGGNYTAYDMVQDSGSAYNCILSIGNDTAAPGSDATHWDLVASKGDTGATGATGPAGTDGTNGTNGQGFTWRGTWSSGGNYTAYDVAYNGGSVYNCILSIENDTTAPGSDGTHWSLMASKGDTGSQGPAGILYANTDSGNISVSQGNLTFHANNGVSVSGNNTTKIVTITFNGNATYATTAGNATYATTAANGGVTGIVAGSGISVSSNTGNVTISSSLSSYSYLFFGDGSDGNYTVNADTGNVTLSRDMFYQNLTIAPGYSLNPNGYRIFCTGTLTINGLMRCNGNNGGNGSVGGYGGNGSSGWSGDGGTPGAPAYSYAYLGTSQAGIAADTGGQGGAGGRNNNGYASSNGANGATGAASSYALVLTNGNSGNAGVKGGIGGNASTFIGGGAGSVGNGGTGGNASYPASEGGWRTITAIPKWRTDGSGEAFTGIGGNGNNGVSSGGGGGGGTTSSGGGGGGGGGGDGGNGGPGGNILIIARYVVLNSTPSIQVKGGNGGNGGAGGHGGNGFTSSTSAGGGGGGGGGGGQPGNGGVIVIVSFSVTGSGTTDKSSGSPGLGGNGGLPGTGTGGTAGVAGASGNSGASGVAGSMIIVLVS